MEKMFVCLVIWAAMGCAMMRPVDAMVHIVGGSFGWSVPSNLSFYEEWAKSRTFGVGDKLVFMYRTGVHNVLEVNEKNFNACTQNEAADVQIEGPTRIELTKPGAHFYLCGVGTHCQAGQKLSITVTGETGSAGKPVTFDGIAPSPANAAELEHKHKQSAANSILNFGVVSGLLFMMVSLLI